MRLHLLPLKPHLAPLLKETIALIRTVHRLQRTVNRDVSLDVPSLDLSSALVLALDDRLRTVVLDVFLHVVQGEHQPAFEQTLNYPVGALVILVSI